MDTSVKAFPVLSVIYGLSRYHGSHYCFPSQLTFIDLLMKRHDVQVSIATFNRWLRAVEDAGYLKRIRRIRRSRSGAMEFNSTLYHLTVRGYLLLARLGVVLNGKIKALMAELRNKAAFVSKKEEKVPAWKDETITSTPEAAARAVKAIEALDKRTSSKKAYDQWQEKLSGK